MNAWLQALSERERRLVIFGAVGAVLLLVFAVMFPLGRSVASAHNRIAQKQQDLAWMKGVAPQLAAAGSVAAPPTTQESLIVLIDRSARELGLGANLTSSEPSGQGGLRVRLEKAPFDILVGWLARLSDQNGIKVESATVDGAGEPGVVNASIVLRSP
jgi:type II secretory pathway component PulM